MKLPIDYESATWQERREARNQYIEEQDGKCYYCQSPLNGIPSPAIAIKKVNNTLFPENFFKWPVHLHHSHDTGLTFGAVHSHCNAVLWEYDEE